MKINYYSEVLKKNFDSEEECVNAEKEYEEKHAKELALREERAERAKEVNEAYKKYLELRSNFVKDYGSYHISLTEKDIPALNSVNFWDLFNNLWF